MKHILFLAHRAPFPPDRGDRIRSYHQLRYLAARALVHLVAFVDDARDLTVSEDDRAMLVDCRLIVRAKPAWRAAGEALVRGEPVSVAAFRDSRLAAAVEDVLARQPIDAIYAFSGQMAQYLPFEGPRAVMDFVDRDSAKFAAYAQRTYGPQRWMMRREARLLEGYENMVAARVAASLFVSAAEAALLPGAIAVENGIDAARFDPAGDFAQITRAAPLIIFTGQMDYRPNIEAVEHFVRSVLPAIRNDHPDARLAIVGRAPTAAVRSLAGEGVIVTGEVADVRGWIAAARVVVAPLKLARGVQNKVLEAMAMARPVVASTAAAEGIDHGGTIRVAENVEAMAAQICALIANPAMGDALGGAARAHVMQRYGWDARLAPLDGLLGLDSVQVAA